MDPVTALQRRSAQLEVISPWNVHRQQHEVIGQQIAHARVAQQFVQRAKDGCVFETGNAGVELRALDAGRHHGRAEAAGWSVGIHHRGETTREHVAAVVVIVRSVIVVVILLFIDFIFFMTPRLFDPVAAVDQSGDDSRDDRVQRFRHQARSSMRLV